MMTMQTDEFGNMYLQEESGTIFLLISITLLFSAQHFGSRQFPLHGSYRGQILLRILKNKRLLDSFHMIKWH